MIWCHCVSGSKRKLPPFVRALCYGLRGTGYYFAVVASSNLPRSALTNREATPLTLISRCRAALSVASGVLPLVETQRPSACIWSINSLQVRGCWLAARTWAAASKGGSLLGFLRFGLRGLLLVWIGVRGHLRILLVWIGVRGHLRILVGLHRLGLLGPGGFRGDWFEDRSLNWHFGGWSLGGVLLGGLGLHRLLPWMVFRGREIFPPRDTQLPRCDTRSKVIPS